MSNFVQINRLHCHRNAHAFDGEIIRISQGRTNESLLYCHVLSAGMQFQTTGSNTVPVPADSDHGAQSVLTIRISTVHLWQSNTAVLMDIIH